MPSQFFAPPILNQWDENHDGENVDHPSVWAQSECKTVQQENHAYAENDHHDEDVGITKASRQSYSLMNQSHMSDG
jgi:hypothetical protein